MKSQQRRTAPVLGQGHLKLDLQLNSFSITHLLLLASCLHGAVLFDSSYIGLLRTQEATHHNIVDPPSEETVAIAKRLINATATLGYESCVKKKKGTRRNSAERILRPRPPPPKILYAGLFPVF